MTQGTTSTAYRSRFRSHPGLARRIAERRPQARYVGFINPNGSGHGNYSEREPLRQAHPAGEINLLALFAAVAYVIGSAAVLLSLWLGLIWLAAVIAEAGQALR